MATPTAAPFDHLFVNDAELRRRINPAMGRDRFRATVRAAEASGFPPVQKLWGGRYWPKVRAWLDKHNRLDELDVFKMADDGHENFDAAPGRRISKKTPK